MSDTTVVLLIIGIIVYKALIFGRRINERRLEKMRHCTDEELPSALFNFILGRSEATLREISDHFSRPMEKIKKELQKSKYLRIIKASLDEKDPGNEVWIIG